MNGAQVSQLLAMLQSAYPAAPMLDQASLQGYRKCLFQLSWEIGQEAVEGAVAGERFFPTIAALNEQAHYARDRMRRRREEELRRAERYEEDNLDRPQLRDVPAVTEFLQRWHIDPLLPETEEGPCGDCQKEGKRWDYDSKLKLCSSCAASRVQARKQVDLIDDVPTVTKGSP